VKRIHGDGAKEKIS